MVKPNGKEPRAPHNPTREKLPAASNYVGSRPFPVELSDDTVTSADMIAVL